MRNVVAMGLAMLALGCGGSNRPCTTCPNVSGLYKVTSPAVDSPSDDCWFAYWNGYDGALTVTQTGSAITLDTVWFTAPGTLFDDNSLGCSATKTYSAWDKLSVNGAFSGSEGKRAISLNLSITETWDGVTCHLYAHMNGAQSQ
jgi:hypothetical protein